MYTFHNFVYSLDEGGSISGTELVEVDPNTLSKEEMWEYQRELGYKDSEIEDMLNPKYEEYKMRQIDPNWYSELTEVPESTKMVNAIIRFEEEFQIDVPPPAAFFGSEETGFELMAQRARIEAIEDHRALVEEAQEPYIERLDDAGAEIVEQFWIVNGMHISFPADKIDSILAIDGVLNIEPVKAGHPDDLSSMNHENGHPYRTLLDNNRALGINLYKTAGYDGRGTTGIFGSGRIKVGVIEDSKFEENHCAFYDSWCETGTSRVFAVRDCDINPCGTTLPDAVECPGGSPQHGMASTGIIAADLEDAQDELIPSNIRGHYSGIAPESSLAYFKASDSEAFVRGFQEAAVLGIDVLSMSWGFSANGDCPNEEEWGGNDAVSSAAMNLVLAGTILVKSAGNENPYNATEGCQGAIDRIPNSITAPGNSPYVVTVGAHNFLNNPREAPTNETLWDEDQFKLVSQIKDYSSRGVTWKQYRKPNITAYTDVVHYPVVDRDKTTETDLKRYADVTYWNSQTENCPIEPDEYKELWWIRADDRYDIFTIGKCFPNDGFDSHECVHDSNWPEWKNISVYRPRAGGTSAAAPAVAGIMVDFKDWYLQTWGATSANERGRIIANVLNFGDGAVDGDGGAVDTSDADYGLFYFGFGDDTYGAGRIHARLFTDAGMDSPYRWDDKVVYSLETGDNILIDLNDPAQGLSPLPIPTGADLLKIFIYWEEPFYNNYPANIQAVLRRTLSTNCSGGYIPVHVQSSNDTSSTKYTKGNWLHFVLDNSQPDSFSRVVENKCYQLAINGVSVPDGYGNVNNGHRSVYIAWFYEDLARDDLDGPCKHNPTGSCTVMNSSYLYFH